MTVPGGLTAPLLGSPNVFGAASFNGTVYLSRDAVLTGVAASTLVTGSVWFKPTAVDANQYLLAAVNVASSVIGFSVLITSDAKVRVTAVNSVGTTILSVSTSANVLAGAWNQIEFAFDMTNAAKRFMYLNGVSDLASVLAYTNDLIAFNLLDRWSVGAVLAALKLTGCQAEGYAAPGQYLDISINRNKFRESGKPADLGADGSRPTGTAPAIYLHLGKAEPAANYAANRGTGGAFTEISGSLSSCATSPSD